jgi:hypothetical protein
MTTKNHASLPSIVVREEAGGSWSVALPHAERQGSVFITFANDEEEALWLASQMRPELEVHVVH